MPKIKTKKTDNSFVLKMIGDLTIERTQEIYDTFTQSLNETDELLIDIAEATKVDLTFFQLLYSAYLSSAAMNKKVKLLNPLSESFRETIKYSGFSHVGFFNETKALDNV